MEDKQSKAFSFGETLLTPEEANRRGQDLQGKTKGGKGRPSLNFFKVV